MLRVIRINLSNLILRCHAVITRHENITAIIAIFGILVSVLLNYQLQKFQTEHDFQQSLLKEQIDADIKLLETMGGIISQQDNKLSDESIKLKQQFITLYYGKTLFFETCLFKNTDRATYLRNLKQTVEDYYDSDMKGIISLDDLKSRTFEFSKALPKFYKIEENHECHS